MIISTEAIIFFFIGKILDEKMIVEFAKYCGIKISDSDRKNMENAFSRKHKSTPTTEINIKNIIKNIIKYLFNKCIKEDMAFEDFTKEIDDCDFSSKIDLSTPELNLEYINSGYELFFKSAGLEKDFIAYEVNNISDAFLEIILFQKDGASNQELKKAWETNDVLSIFNFDTDLHIDITACKVVHGVFNLNVLLYLFACLEFIKVEDKEGVVCSPPKKSIFSQS